MKRLALIAVAVGAVAARASAQQAAIPSVEGLWAARSINAPGTRDPADHRARRRAQRRSRRLLGGGADERPVAEL